MESSPASRHVSPGGEPPLKVFKALASPLTSLASPDTTQTKESAAHVWMEHPQRDHMQLLLKKKDQCEEFLLRTEKLKSLIEKEKQAIEKELAQLDSPQTNSPALRPLPALCSTSRS